MLKLALRNVFRHGVRTAVTLVAVVVGVAALILSGGFVQDIFLQLGEAVIHSNSGHLQVTKRGFQAEGTRKPTSYLIDDPAKLIGQFSTVPGVTDAMARVSFTGLLNNGRSDVPVTGEGVDPEREARLGTYVRLVSGRQLTARDGNAVLVGNGVAQALKLATGDRTTLVVSTSGGATNTLDVVVVGIFQTFSKDYDARTVKVPLSAAHDMLADRGANTIVISLAETRDTEKTAAVLRAAVADAGLEVSTWLQLNDFYEKTVKLYDRQFAVLRLIILAMVLLSTANSVNMSVFERIPEFGTMRALGSPSRAVFAMVMTESFLLAVIGSVLGVVAGVALAVLISAIGIPMPPPPNADLGYVARIQIVPTEIVTAFFAGVIATTFGGIFAAIRVVRISIVDALRLAI